VVSLQKKTGLVSFLLPEFNLKTKILGKFPVGDQLKALDTYGMTIGRDLLRKLCALPNFNYKTVT
jgi:hypothetical protein